MRSLLHLDEIVRAPEAGTASTAYTSTVTQTAVCLPGVRYTIHRMSFGRRMDLCRRVRELSRKLDFLKAGSEFEETVEANLLAQEVSNLYLRWGLAGIDGLTIDGCPATAELLVERGPVTLSKEIAAAIQAECSLSDEERKN